MKKIYVNDMEFINSITKIKVDTPDGLQEIGDTVIKKEKCSRLFTNNTIIETANNHLFFTDKWVKLENININDKLKSKDGYDNVENISETSVKKVYDFEVLHDNHRYYSNGLVSHNSGKSLLSIMAALATSRGEKRYKFYNKILVTKPPVSINRDMYTGFKPGTSEEKMSGHLGGIKTNLKYLLDTKSTKKLKPGEEPELESDKAWEETFDIIEIDEIQGTSLHGTIFLVDEYQLMDIDTLKLVMSRIAEDSKLVLIGDTAGQTYGQNRANEGFKVLYKHLGKAPEFNFIKMENIYRSKLASFVSDIFDD